MSITVKSQFLHEHTAVTEIPAPIASVGAGLASCFAAGVASEGT